MSNQPEREWTEDEKYTLLTEILKKAGVPSIYLVKMIKEFRISPSWGDIPLPPGRSLNSCKTAFYSMCQQHMQPSMGLGSFQQLRHDSPASSASLLESSPMRKRPFFPSDKPILAPAPRPIQPRPPINAASFSSESGTSTHLSSFENLARGEPPRKRGRPSKAETERRKAAAEARGETYPPPRRTGAGKLKQEFTPNSPAGTEHTSTSSALNPSAQGPEVSKLEVRHESSKGGAATTVGPSGDEQTRHGPGSNIGPITRELPRPSDVMQALPSPQTLQLGTRGAIPRLSTGGRPFDAFVSRETHLAEGSRQVLVDSRTQSQPPAPSPGVTSGTSGERRLE